MSPKLNTYQFGSFTVQSYLKEEETSRLFAYALRRKLMGRTAPPRKGFMGMASKLLWEKKFEFEGRPYIIQGGGKRIAFFEFDLEQDIDRSGTDAAECAICELPHPTVDLISTDRGTICPPCYEVWFPVCEDCGARIELSDEDDPEDGPFYCESCGERRNG